MNDVLPYREVIILSIPYSVVEVPPTHHMMLDQEGDEKYYGRVDWERHAILVNSIQTFAEKLETLTHEIAHIIVREMDEWDLAEEKMLRVFNRIYFDTIRRNRIDLLEQWENST